MEPTTTKLPLNKMKLKLRLSRFKSGIKVFHRLVKKKKNKKLTRSNSSRKVIIASSKGVNDDATDKNSTDDKSIQKDMPPDATECPGTNNSEVIFVEEGKGNYAVDQGEIIDVINIKAIPKEERMEEGKTNEIKSKDTVSETVTFSLNVIENTPQDTSETIEINGNESTKPQAKHEENENKENDNSIINIEAKTEVENMENKNVNNDESRKSPEETDETCGSDLKDASSNTTEEDHGIPENANLATKKDDNINHKHINERAVIQAPNVEDRAFENDEIGEEREMVDDHNVLEEPIKPVSALKDWLVDFGRESHIHYEKNIVKNSIAARFSDANRTKRELFVEEMRAAAEEGEDSDDSDDEGLWTDDEDDEKESEPKSTPGNKDNKKKKKRHSRRKLRKDVISFKEKKERSLRSISQDPAM